MGYSQWNTSTAAVSTYYIKLTGNGQPYTGYTVNSDGSPSSTTVYSSSSYDPTTTGWYTSATKTASWSAPFMSTGVNPYPAIAYSAPVFVSNNTLVAVISATRRLSKVSDLLAPYAKQHTVSYIMDSSHGLVATTTGENVWSTSTGGLKPATSSTSYFVSQSAGYLISNGITSNNEFSATMTNGQTMTIGLTRWSDSTGLLRWSIVTVDVSGVAVLYPVQQQLNKISNKM